MRFKKKLGKILDKQTSSEMVATKLFYKIGGGPYRMQLQSMKVFSRESVQCPLSWTARLRTIRTMVALHIIFALITS